MEARTLPDAPNHLPNVQTLRTLADCRAIDQEMTRADSIAIIGGGFIGCEVATSARHRALTTTIIIDISPTLLGHAIGTRPRNEFHVGLGLDLSDGVLCGPTCHVIGLDDAVAAGDRVEHWINAVEHARAAADALLAGPSQAEPFAPIPRFQPEQHDIKIQSLGLPRLADRVTLTERDPRSHRTIATYHRAEQLVGVIAIDEPRWLLDYTRELTNSIGKPIITQAASPDPYCSVGQAIGQPSASPH